MCLTLNCSYKLEGHCACTSDIGVPTGYSSVNKTILKPHLVTSLQRRAANTYTWDFPDVKLRVAPLIRYRRKQSGSGIRIWLKS